ncbi:hypothetical protein MZM54_02200 [[Brevibacterium] frigoritolerans]|nr:hypothetical protein [Peribacillus frigoritolerans]
MQTYTIGEIISKFKTVKDKAFAYKGDIKGTLIFVDTDNRNHLTSISEEGSIYDSFSIILNEDLTEEESRDWVFVTEICSDPIGNQEIINGIRLTLSNAKTSIYNQMSEQAKDVTKIEKNAQDIIKLEGKIR